MELACLKLNCIKVIFITCSVHFLSFNLHCKQQFKIYVQENLENNKNIADHYSNTDLRASLAFTKERIKKSEK